MLPVIPTTRIMRERQLTQSCIISAVLKILLTVLYKKNVNNVGALIVITGFGGISYYTYNKEPPKPYSIYYGKRSQPQLYSAGQKPVSGLGMMGVRSCASRLACVCFFRRIFGFTMVRCRQVLGTERGSPQNNIGVLIINGETLECTVKRQSYSDPTH